ncbi:MAG: hypothetical protein FWF97_03205 [Alphaproteobacteria bacterium]|nr:hypothetical protein [Alphaproteobacteria bacterium]
MNLQLIHLHPEFDRLQKKHGAQGLCSIYGAGCTKRPRACFVFINPTGRNPSARKEWNGFRAPWIGIKNAWKLFNQIGIISDRTAEIISAMPADIWSSDLAEELYSELAGNGIYVTNLGKCTQVDARSLSDKVFSEYAKLLEKEINEIQPEVIVTFGNQVSSIFLDRTIAVSSVRRQSFAKNIMGREYKTFPVFYPVGNGFRNVNKAIEDLKFILCKTNKKS